MKSNKVVFFQVIVAGFVVTALAVNERLKPPLRTRQPNVEKTVVLDGISL